MRKLEENVETHPKLPFDDKYVQRPTLFDIASLATKIATISTLLFGKTRIIFSILHASNKNQRNYNYIGNRQFQTGGGVAQSQDCWEPYVKQK